MEYLPKILELSSFYLRLFEILFLRGLLATGALIMMCWYLNALQWRHSARDWSLMIARSGSEIAAAYFFLTALINMPIANVTAILQTLPLTVSLGGVLFFKNMGHLCPIIVLDSSRTSGPPCVATGGTTHLQSHPSIKRGPTWLR